MGGDMDAFIGLLVVVGVMGSLVLLEVLAIWYGADSRDRMTDDWSRPAHTRGSFPRWR
jgi:hypothetical protein